MNISDLIPPSDTKTEKAVLGALLVDQHGILAVVDFLKTEHFYDTSHQQIYSALATLFERNIPIDILTLKSELDKEGVTDAVGGLSYILELTNTVASSANVEHHARIIVQLAMRRSMIAAGHRLIKSGHDLTADEFQEIDSAESMIYNVLEQHTSSQLKPVDQVGVDMYRRLKKIQNNNSTVTGITTGYEELDKLTAGWQPSDLVIIAARPGMGKTAMVICFADHAATAGHAVAIFSLEMTRDQLVQRLVAKRTGIHSTKIKHSRLDTNDWHKLEHEVDDLRDVPIYIDDTPALSLTALRTKCRRQAKTVALRLIIVDYLQLMTVGGLNNKQSREQEISTISRGLKALAKELDVPIIALSQLSRAVESRGDKRPQLSDLRESGAIEQDADMVNFIYRPGYYDQNEDPAITEFITAKHRAGDLATNILSFEPHCVRFVEPQFKVPFANRDFITPSMPPSNVFSRDNMPDF